MRWYNKSGYLIDGATVRDARKHDLVPGVTSILSLLDKPFLTTWRLNKIVELCKKHPNEEWPDLLDRYYLAMDSYSTRGQQAHRYLSKDVDGIFVEPLIKKSIDKYFEENEVSFDKGVELEKTFIGELDGYVFGGTVDYIGDLNNRDVIIDYKTQDIKDKSFVIYPEYRLQLVAYRYLTGYVFHDLINVLFPTNGGLYKIKKCEDYDREERIFKNLLEIFYATNKLGRFKK